MFTLIKREIYDHIAYFVGTFILLLIITITIISKAFNRNSDNAIIVYNLALYLITILFIYSSASMGISQMHADRNKKISAFVTTLPVDRNQILIARICTGVLAILFFFLPQILITEILYSIFKTPIPTSEGVFFDLISAGILMSFACYFIGLQTGWSASRIIPALGGLLLSSLLMTMIIIKGLGIEISLLLILFIIASIIKVREKFISTSL